MDNETLEHIPGGGLCTSCDHKMENDHQIPSLTLVYVAEMTRAATIQMTKAGST